MHADEKGGSEWHGEGKSGAGSHPHWETETRENLRGLDRRGLNGALAHLQH